MADAEVVDDRSADAVMWGESNDFGVPRAPSLEESLANGKRMIAADRGRLLIERIEASTDIDDVAGQRALEKASFTREGVLRRAQFRAGDRHDLVSYSILRDEL